MSQLIPEKPHLWEDTLSEKADEERRNLSVWASSVQATFKKKAEDFETHESVELHAKVLPLLGELGLRAKGYSLVHIPGPTSVPFTHANGEAYIIPLEILGGHPTVSGRPLQEGKAFYMKAKQGVEISPKLRLLFVLL